MTNDIFIDMVKLENNEVIPTSIFPKRYAIATNILCTLKTESVVGVLLLNSEPHISNTWYPFYTTINDYHTFVNEKYQSLVAEYETSVITGIAKDRISLTKKKFSEKFMCGNILVENMQRNEYWLKYSKSSNVWTIYLFEFYIVASIEKKESLISCLNEYNAILPIEGKELNTIITNGSFNNVPIASNVKELLKDPLAISLLQKNII